MEATIKTRISKEVENKIVLPYYCKGGSSFFKVYSEKYAIRVSGGMVSERAEIGFVNSSLPFEVYDREGELETITAADFKSAYEIALNQLNQF